MKKKPVSIESHRVSIECYGSIALTIKARIKACRSGWPLIYGKTAFSAPGLASAHLSDLKVQEVRREFWAGKSLAHKILFEKKAGKQLIIKGNKIAKLVNLQFEDN